MKKYVVLSIVFITIAGLIFSISKTDKDRLEVKAVKASKADIVKYIDIAGTIEAYDYEEIKPASGQKVIKTYVSENQVVEKGQKLAELDPGDASYLLEKARLREEQLKQELDELKKPSTAAELQKLKNELTKADSTYKNLERKLREAEEKMHRSEKLYQAGAVPESDYDAAVSVKEDLSVQLSQAGIELDNARNRLNDYGSSNSLQIKTKVRELAINSTEIKNLEKKLEDSIIKASAKGMVVEFPLKEGRFVEPDEKIMIYDLSKLIFKGAVDQEDAVLVNEGQAAAVSVKGVDKDFEAKVSTVKSYAMLGNSSTSLTPKVELELLLQDRDKRLTVGFDADAQVEVGKVADVLAVPREAVKKAADGKAFIYIVENEKVKKVLIEVGIFDDYKAEIKAGIKEGDLIVINPPEALKDGDRVRVNLK